MEKPRLSKDTLNELGTQIVDSCYEVHHELGPGLLESVYVIALMKKLEMRGFKVRKNVPIKLYYKATIRVRNSKWTY